MGTLVTHISCAHKPVGAEAALQGEIPYQDLRRTEMPVEYLGEGDVLRECCRGPWVGGTKLSGERICHAATAVGISEVDVGKIHDRSERRNSNYILKRNQVWRLVVIAGTAADAGFSVFRQLVGKAKARADIAKRRIDRRLRTSRIMIASAEDQARRRIRITHR